MTEQTELPELAELRAQLERIDETLVATIEERLRVAHEIGRVKQAAGLPLVHPAREAAVVRRAGELARARGLDAEAMRTLFWRVIEMSRRAQE